MPSIYADFNHNSNNKNMISYIFLGEEMYPFFGNHIATPVLITLVRDQFLTRWFTLLSWPLSPTEPTLKKKVKMNPLLFGIEKCVQLGEQSTLVNMSMTMVHHTLQDYQIIAERFVNMDATQGFISWQNGNCKWPICPFLTVICSACYGG